jgi:hypothetical protein
MMQWRSSALEQIHGWPRARIQHPSLRRFIRLDDQPATQPVKNLGECRLLDRLGLLPVDPQSKPPFTPKTGSFYQLDFKVGPDLFIFDRKTESGGRSRHEQNQNLTPKLLPSIAD